MMATNLEVLEDWYQRVWNEGDETAIDKMFMEGTKARGLGSQTRIGPEGFKEFHAYFFQLMKDFDVKVDQSMEQDDWIHALCTLYAKKREGGEPVSMTGSVTVRIAEGQLAEAYNHWDFMGLYQQLGLMPPDAFDKCLCGEKIA
ncbi:MAG: ester cyclase [Planctomycetaceae bacterium]|nr:ester cyclase [Planctomycetaceae bacterium]